MSKQSEPITVLYCRLSQEDTKEGESNSIAKGKGVRNTPLFADDGFSGIVFNRLGLLAMTDGVKSGDIKSKNTPGSAEHSLVIGTLLAEDFES